MSTHIFIISVFFSVVFLLTIGLVRRNQDNGMNISNTSSNFDYYSGDEDYLVDNDFFEDNGMSNLTSLSHFLLDNSFDC